MKISGVQWNPDEEEFQARIFFGPEEYHDVLSVCDRPAEFEPRSAPVAAETEDGFGIGRPGPWPKPPQAEIDKRVNPAKHWDSTYGGPNNGDF